MDVVSALLERDGQLSDLHAALARARSGGGELAVVAGEAGAGKTSLINEFVRRAAGSPLVLRGSCDPLTVPRPLGPLIDAARDADPALAQRLVEGASRTEALALALSLVDGTISNGRATILVIEDAHWADDATLDLLTFLGRRIDKLGSLLIVSYRDDEVGPGHPLRARLGELTPAIRCRVGLPPLSSAAVAHLADGTGIDPDALHQLSGGNAFYVTEVLATRSATLPASVVDAVLARASRLGESARTVLDAAAVLPGRAERWLLGEVASEVDVDAGVETCLGLGLLQLDGPGDSVLFRHELARLAILDAMQSSRARGYHRRILSALASSRAGNVDSARLSFHAFEADDATAVLHHAPTAAADAARVGAHREAVLHLERARRYAGHLDAPARAALLSRLGVELTVVGQSAEAIAIIDEAASIYASIGDTERQAESMLTCNKAFSSLGRQVEADERLERAAQLLEGRAPSHAAALVATVRAASSMLARQFERAELEGQSAIGLAEEIGDRAVLAEALIQTGIAMAMNRDDRGLQRLRRGIDVATQVELDDLVSLAHLQIGSGYGEMRRYDVAVPALRDGIAFAEPRELLTHLHYDNAWLARCELELGDWDSAAARATTLVRNQRCIGINRFVALITLGWIRGRRGDPGAWPLLDEAAALARSTGHLQRLWPVAACRAEIAWFADRIDDESDLIQQAAALAADLDYRPAIEELAHWQHLADGMPRQFDDPRTPFGMTAAGRADEAALAWAFIGCPYEEAVALFLAGDAAQLLGAHRIFDSLGANPMRTRVATAMRELGIAVPRGPTNATRDNPYALTARELDVLALLASGRTDREIADELVISTKTVGHHVSHLLAKLDVRSRSAAAVVAERLGLTAPP